MERFVITPPATWVAQPAAKGNYVSDGARFRVTELAPLPDDLSLFFAAELRRAGDPAATIQRGALASAWPVTFAEMDTGATRRLLLVVHIVDHGLIAALEAPAAGYDAAKAELLDVLSRGELIWGAAPRYTLAELLRGAKD